jgi:hypothetical protein
VKGTSEHRGRCGTLVVREARIGPPDRPALHVQPIKFPLNPSVKVTSRADQFRRPLNLSVEKGIIVSWPRSETPVCPATSIYSLRPPLQRLTSSVVCILF